MARSVSWKLRPEFVCNHSDHGGRYAFDRQPQVDCGIYLPGAGPDAYHPVEQAQEALKNYEPVSVTIMN